MRTQYDATIIWKFTKAALVALTLGVSGSAFAAGTPLSPGGVVAVPFITTDSGAPIATMTSTFSSSPLPSLFSGSVTTDVISGDTGNPLNGLDFLYIVTNNSSSVDSIGRVIQTNFAFPSLWLTDVGFIAGVAPTAANRTSSGVAIGWTFLFPALDPGSSTALLVQTNAGSFTERAGFFIDGGTAIAGIFGPIPEPEIYAMMGIGLALMGFVARRRKGQDAAA